MINCLLIQERLSQWVRQANKVQNCNCRDQTKLFRSDYAVGIYLVSLITGCTCSSSPPRLPNCTLTQDKKSDTWIQVEKPCFYLIELVIFMIFIQTRVLLAVEGETKYRFVLSYIIFPSSYGGRRARWCLSKSCLSCGTEESKMWFDRC